MFVFKTTYTAREEELQDQILSLKMALGKAQREAEKSAAQVKELEDYRDSLLSSFERMRNLHDEGAAKAERLQENYDLGKKQYEQSTKDFQAACKTLRERGDKYRDALDDIIARVGEKPRGLFSTIRRIASKARAK